MSYFNPVGKRGKPMVEVARESVKDVQGYAVVDIPQRGIRKEILEKFGVKVALSEADGVTPEAVYFPSYNQKGKIVGYAKQDLTKDKEERGHWSTVGNVRITNKLFGQDIAEDVQRKRSNLIVTEGQWDTLSVYQSLVDNVEGTKYAGLEPFVVSIPLGTANAVESILQNEEFVKDFTSMTIFFDDDHCTPQEKRKGILKGKEATEAVASALVGSGLSLFVVSLPEGMKDASDMMQDGRTDELARAIQFNKKTYISEKIVKAGDISFEELMEPRPEGIYVNEFPELMQKIHGFRTRELVLLSSPSGVGKTSVASIFANAFADQGEKVGMIYLEETNKETLQRLVAHKLGVNYLRFKDSPLECASEEEIRQAYQDIVDNDKLVMLNHFGSLPVHELMNKIKQMHLVEGCRYIILDHLSVVISGSVVADERKELDIVMTELAAFCAANDVCVIAISHINRSAAELFKMPKGHDESEPFWVRITKEMLRGSSALEALSFIVMGLEPQIMPDRSRGNVRLTVLKNRPWGYLGVCDEFHIDQNTWDVVLATQEQEREAA